MLFHTTNSITALIWKLDVVFIFQTCYILIINLLEGKNSMLSTISDVREYLERYEELNVDEILALELNLNKLLKSISEKSTSSSANTNASSTTCPHCSSNNTIKHTKDLIPRFLCKRCLRTFTANRQLLFYRKKKPSRIIDFIVYVHTTDMSITEIAKELDISLKTYYRWRSQLISVLPQLTEEFNNQRKK